MILEVVLWMTEFSGFKWSIFFMSEYANMLIVSLVASFVFLGGWLSPFTIFNVFPDSWLIFDVPVLYFPKFFHPDPTVKRQTGFLKPEINDSKINGTSITTPYFFDIANNKDFTFKPTWFGNNFFTLQNEFRLVKKNYNLLTDFLLYLQFLVLVHQEMYDSTFQSHIP